MSSLELFLSSSELDPFFGSLANSLRVLAASVASVMILVALALVFCALSSGVTISPFLFRVSPILAPGMSGCASAAGAGAGATTTGAGGGTT